MVALSRLLKMMLHMDLKLSLIIYPKSVTPSLQELKLIVHPAVPRQLGSYIYCQPQLLGLLMVGRHLRTLFSMRNPSLVVQRGLGINHSVNARRLLSLLTSLVAGYTLSFDLCVDSARLNRMRNFFRLLPVSEASSQMSRYRENPSKLQDLCAQISQNGLMLTTG